MAIRAFDFTSPTYSKTKSFMAKENVSNTAKLKQKKRAKENELAGVKSSWTPLKQELNEKLFDERKELVSNWFDRWSDAQRRTALDILVPKCKPAQLQYIFSLISERIPVTHIDFTRKLPRVISVYIFSFLDPRSLCRCSQVCWYWKHLSELDHVWMPKCLKFGWFLPFVPSPFEQGVWKRHYLESVLGLQYMRPQSDLLGSSALNNKTADGRPTIRKSQSQSSLPGSRKTKRAGSAQEMPPWRGPDTRPADIVRKAKGTDNPIVGCRRCHMSKHPDVEAELQHLNHSHQPKKQSNPKTKAPRIKPVTSAFAPESEQAGTKFDTRSGRPDWAVQASIAPMNATRPPAPVVRPSPLQMGRRREARDLPVEDLFPGQPWRRPANDYDSD